jgi:DNA (cytosine-5)-methyltransferase 1
MLYGSVCSGIEAATVAWHPLGWKPAFFSEIEPFPCAVLAHHYPDIPNHGDMTQFERWPAHAIRLLVGGTPCQDYSVAGLRLGMAGGRGQLTLVFVEILGRYRPAWFVWENVPGVLSSNEGRDFGRFLGELTGHGIEPPAGGWKNAGIVTGGPDSYGVAWRVLDAQFTRTRLFPAAVPQRRRRVFVVGYLGDWRPAAAVLLDGESLRGDPPPRREQGQGIAGTLNARSEGGGGLGTDFELGGGLVPEVANPLTARMHKGVNTTMDEGQTMVAHTLKAEGFDASEDGSGHAAVAYGLLSDASRDGSAKTPSADAEGRVRLRDPGLGVSEGISPTLDSSGPHAVASALQVRRLTPRECERLQAFPDDYTRIPGAASGGWRDIDEDEDLDELRTLGLPLKLRGNRWRVQDPDGPRYKALGNSMAVNVMQLLGERIDMVDRLIREGKS